MLSSWLTDTVTSDLDRALHYTLLWGLEGVELRTVGGPGERVPFVNESKLKRRLQESDLPVVGVDPGLFEGPLQDVPSWMNDVLALEETLQFCRRMDCPTVILSGFAPGDPFEADRAVNALARAGKAADKYGIDLAVTNGRSMAINTGSRLAALLKQVDHPRIGAAWCPAEAVSSGEDARQGLEALEGRVKFVRCYDVRVERGDWVECPVGDGSVNWSRQLELLEQQGYTGAISLQVLRAPRPKTGVKDAMTLIDLIRSARRKTKKP